MCHDKVTTTTVVVHDVKYLEGNSRTKMQRRFTLPTLCVPSTCMCMCVHIRVRTGTRYRTTGTSIF